LPKTLWNSAAQVQIKLSRPNTMATTIPAIGFFSPGRLWVINGDDFIEFGSGVVG